MTATDVETTAGPEPTNPESPFERRILIEQLRYYVGRQITDSTTGEVLDARRAVAFDLDRPGRGTQTFVVAASVWDEHRAKFLAAGTVTDVLDGRVLHAA